MLFRHLVKSSDNLNLDYHSRAEHNKPIDLNMNVILLVGMADSPHFAKWLQATRQEFPGRKILVYPSDRPRFKDTKILLRKKNRSRDLVIFYLIPFNIDIIGLQKGEKLHEELYDGPVVATRFPTISKSIHSVSQGLIDTIHSNIPETDIQARNLLKLLADKFVKTK